MSNWLKRYDEYQQRAAAIDLLPAKTKAQRTKRDKLISAERAKYAKLMKEPDAPKPAPLPDPWEAALTTIDVRRTLKTTGIAADDNETLRRVGKALKLVTEGAELPAAPVECGEAKGVQQKRSPDRQTTTTIERDVQWLREFERGDWRTRAAFAQFKGVEPPAMRAALKRAKSHQRKSPKTSGRK